MKTVMLTMCMLFFTMHISGQEFANELQIPPLISDDNYALNVIETMHNFNPDGTGDLNTLIPTFAFEDANNPGTTTILGPTITWSYLHQMAPTVTNMLSEVTTSHWHGAHVPQPADGGPHQRIEPGTTWSPEFQVLDKSATMWYHPHAMGLTYKHVQMGLSGIIIVEDPEDGLDDPILSELHEILPNEYGVDDFPLVFQTKKFKEEGGSYIIQADQGFKKDYEYMVNGIIDPYLNVPAGMVRLRILNGDGKFSFNFDFEYLDGTNFPAQMIATDAGYMDQSYEMSEILMAPGERTEFLLDLRGLAEGTEIYIKNLVSEMPDGLIGNNSTTDGYAVDRDVLKLVVTGESPNPSPIISFPISLHPLETPPMSEVTNTRTKVFRKDSFFINGQKKALFNIDSTLMDMMVVNDVIKLDSTEIWTIDNNTDIAHPWHIHDIHFWVTEVIDAAGNSLNPDAYPQIFKGPKDNVLVQPGWELSYITTFDTYGTEVRFDSSYMFHCHILPHEDNGMMGQFVVWNGMGSPVGIQEDPSLSTIEMTVYPNPVQDIMFLEGISTKPSKLIFSDLQGKRLKDMQLSSFDGIIGVQTNDLPSGVIIVEWITKEGKAVTKVVLQR